VIRAPIALLVALSLAGPGGAAADERTLDLGIELLSGVDTNPLRALDAGSDADGLVQLLARLRGALEGQRWRLTIALDEGLRLFAETPGARAVASRLEASGAVELGRGFSAGLAAAGNDLTERGGGLDQDALRGEATLAWRAPEGGASLSGGGSLFAPRGKALRPFGARGPEVGLRAWVAPAPGHRLAAGVQLAAADYPRWIEARRDEALGVTAEWAWRGPLVAALGYGFTRNGSSASGGEFRRHRATLRAAVPLAGEAVLVARAALQWTRHPEPLRLPAEQLRIEAGQEALDLADVRVALPLGRGLELTMGAAGQRSEDSGAGQPAYARLLVTIGVAWRARWERQAE